MKMFFLYSYPLVGFISLCAFIPQIKALLNAETSPVNVSIKSWLLWTLSSLIGFGYGVYVLEDLMFCLITGVTLALDFFVLFLVLYRRYVTFGPCRNLGDVTVEYFLRAPYLGVCPSRFNT